MARPLRLTPKQLADIQMHTEDGLTPGSISWYMDIPVGTVRYHSRPEIKERMMAATKRWQEKNKDRVKKKVAEYAKEYATRPGIAERKKLKMQQYAEAHRKEIAEKARLYRKNSPEQYKQARLKYYKSHREQILARTKERRKLKVIS